MKTWEQHLNDPIFGIRVVMWCRKQGRQMPDPLNCTNEEIDAIIILGQNEKNSRMA